MGMNYVIEGTVSELILKEIELTKTKIELTVKETESISEVAKVIKKEIELTKKGNEVAVKIVGSEGYAIKQGDKTYNVFCPKDLSEVGNCSNGYIVDSETEFTVNKDFENILTQASIDGKKIRLTIELEDGKELKDYICENNNEKILDVPIKSVTLLQK